MDRYEGLTEAEVQEQIAKGNVNTAADRTLKSRRQIIRENALTAFNFLNLFLLVLVVLTGKIRNGLFFGTVIFNTAIGIVQEIRAQRLLSKMSLLVEAKIQVRRDGTWKKVCSCNLVKDDCIRLETGMQVPVDCLVVNGSVEVDESILTGESETVVRKNGEEVSAGTVVTADCCEARILRVGKDRTSNRIVAETTGVNVARSQLKETLDQIIRVISKVILPFMVLLFLEHVAVSGMDWKIAILNTTAAIIGMIPEGLVVLTSMALAAGTMRLGRRHVLVQDLYAIESFARADTICLDKTGTLTKGSMSVTGIHCMNGYQEKDLVSSVQRYLAGQKTRNATSVALESYFGKGTEKKIQNVIPFSSGRKYGAVTDEAGTVYIGAFRFLFLMGNDYVEKMITEHAEKGERVLAVAVSSKNPKDAETLSDDLHLAGFLFLADDLRENVQEIMKYLMEQNIDIRVISGDDPVTVQNLAKRAGIPDSDLMVDLSKTDEPMQELVRKYRIFGRVLPWQKKELVEALQKEGHTVAMTGDGVNDVPALKCADVSFAMASGASATRNTASAVLLDNDFSHIPEVIHEGRRVINNISRASSMYFVKTVFSFLLALTVLFTGQSYPFLPIQLTVISAIGVGIPTFLLQSEPSFEKVRKSFFLEALRKAVPSALIISGVTVVLMLLRSALSLQDMEFHGLAVVMASFVYLCTLFRVYEPLTRYRFTVIVLMGILYAVIYIYFGTMVEISCSERLVSCYAFLLLLIPACLKLLDYLINHLWERRKNAERRNETDF